jgi:hypothetical protein
VGTRRIAVHRVVSVHISAQLFVVVFLKLVYFCFRRARRRKKAGTGERICSRKQRKFGNNSPVYWHPVVGRAGEKIQKTHYPSPSQRHGAWRGGTDSFCEEVLQGELETFVGTVRFQFRAE